jgi:hypothetical protein
VGRALSALQEALGIDLTRPLAPCEAGLVRQDPREPWEQRPGAIPAGRALHRGQEGRLEQVLGLDGVAAQVHGQGEQARRGLVEDLAQRLGVAVAAPALEQVLGLEFVHADCLPERGRGYEDSTELGPRLIGVSFGLGAQRPHARSRPAAAVRDPPKSRPTGGLRLPGR